LEEERAVVGGIVLEPKSRRDIKNWGHWKGKAKRSERGKNGSLQSVVSGSSKEYQKKWGGKGDPSGGPSRRGWRKGKGTEIFYREKFEGSGEKEKGKKIRKVLENRTWPG